ncbi:MAG: hypothetical protein LUG66_01335 [Clostridiales bacterium]|nr:hypothetical protein [Clostridiales bacterium]
MKKFDIMGYIRQFQFLIIFISAAAGVLGYAVLKSRQTYTSSAIIRYANDDAVSGLAPDGSEIDTTEIYSSSVISEVFSQLGISYSGYNIDDMRSGVAVDALRSEEKIALDEATIANGEEITEKPVEYRVAFTVKNGMAPNTEDFARQFLDELLNSYISFYGEEHINSSVPAVNDISKINSGSYDYLEKAEILRSSISSANDEIKKRADGANEEFRSSATGYNFSDLQKEFLLLKNIDVWDLYAYILDNHITDAKDVLLAKYQNRIDEYTLTNENSAQQIAYVEGVIDAYVTMMRESGNTDITYEYILSDVDSYWYTSETGEVFDADQTVEYDTLLSKYANLQTDYDEALVEVAYCQYILDVYNGSDSGNTEEARLQAQEMIDSLVDKANNLFEIMEVTNDEYNEYIGAQNIQLVSGIAVDEGIPIGRYALLIALAFGIVGCLGAIILGRLIDIFEYYVYVDHKLNIPNRAACDRLLAKHGRTLVKGEFVCMSVRIDNLRDKNRIYGVEAVDGMISQLVKIMQGVFSGERDCFIGVNSPGQLLVFAEAMTGERARAYCEEIIKAVEVYNENAGCKLAFAAGIAEAREESVYQIKDLMLKAMRKTSYSVSDKDDALNGYMGHGSAAAASESKAQAEENNSASENKKSALGSNYSGSDISKQLDELKKALKD